MLCDSTSKKKILLPPAISNQLETSIYNRACPKKQALTEGSAEYKEYKFQFKRIGTHLRQNPELILRLKGGELLAEQIVDMDDKDLLTAEKLNQKVEYEQQGLKEALGVTAEDTGHWVPSKSFTCPVCQGRDCVYIEIIKGGHGDDNNMDPVITVRCKSCRHLWKEDELEGGRMAAGSEEGNTDDRAPAVSTRGKRPEIWRAPSQSAPTWLLPA